MMNFNPPSNISMDANPLSTANSWETGAGRCARAVANPGEPASRGIPIATHCHLRNHTDDYVTLDSQNNWHGCGHTPKSIQSGEERSIKHRADDAGSVGGVAYLLEDKIKWIVAWNNAEDHHNKVYTKILKANETIDWADIKARLRKSGNQSSVHNVHGYSSKLEIHATSPTPKMTAKLRPAS